MHPFLGQVFPDGESINYTKIAGLAPLSSCKCNEIHHVYMKIRLFLYEILHAYMKSVRVCTNFIWLVRVVKMYAAGV